MLGPFQKCRRVSLFSVIDEIPWRSRSYLLLECVARDRSEGKYCKTKHGMPPPFTTWRRCGRESNRVSRAAPSQRGIAYPTPWKDFRWRWPSTGPLRWRPQRRLGRLPRHPAGRSRSVIRSRRAGARGRDPGASLVHPLDLPARQHPAREGDPRATTGVGVPALAPARSRRIVKNACWRYRARCSISHPIRTKRGVIAAWRARFSASRARRRPSARDHRSARRRARRRRDG